MRAQRMMNKVRGNFVDNVRRNVHAHTPKTIVTTLTKNLSMSYVNINAATGDSH